MAGLYASGTYTNPTQYKKSSLWDQDWAQKAYNTNPYAGYQSKIGNLTSNLSGSLGSGSSKWGVGVADIRDPAALGLIKQYGDYTLSEQRNATDQAVNRMANQGIRGGYGNAGGPSQRSQLQASALSSLAGGAADRFKSGLSYANQLYGAGYGAYRDDMSSLESLLGLEKGALDSATAREMGLFNSRAGDFRDDITTQQQWDMQLPGLVEQEAARQRASQDRGRAQNEALTVDNLLKSITTDLNYNTGANANPFMLGNTAYLRYKGALSPTKYGYA